MFNKVCQQGTPSEFPTTVVGNRLVFTKRRPRYIHNGLDRVAFSRQGLILAMMLGDGYTHRKDNAYLEFVHSAHQKEYAIWKCNLLKRFVRGNSVFFERTFKANEYCNRDRLGFGARTPSHHRITAAHKKLYGDGKKKVTQEVLNKLSPFCVAIWFMDDGCVSWKTKHKNGEPFGVPLLKFVQICSHSFTKEENELIVHWFKERYGIEFNVVEDRRGKNGSLYFVRAWKREDATRFIRLIAPVVNTVPCMRYKILPKINTNIETKIGEKHAS